MQQQAFLVAKAGAKYVAPYVNRMQNLYNNGIKTVKTIHKIFKNNNFDTKILGASFKEIMQVDAMFKIGITAVTLQPDIIYKFLGNKDVKKAIYKFNKNFKTLLKDTYSNKKVDELTWLTD